MSHECIDWEAAPPRPKTPFITISYGGTKLVTRRGAGSKVQEFKALQNFAHRNLSIQDRAPSSLRFRTTCNLGCAPIKNDAIFEVNEEAWEEEGLRDLVGCLEVSLCEDEEVLPGPVKNSDEPPLRVESPQLSYVGGESGAETPQLEDEHGDAQVRVPDKQEEAVRERGDATGSDADALLKVIRASGILDDRKDTMSDEETGLSIKPSSRGRRIVVSDEGDGETPATDSQQKKKAIVDDNSQPSAPIAGATSNTKASALPSPDLAHTSDTERSIKKEKQERPAHRDRVHRSSAAESSSDSRAPGGASPTQSIDQPVKQERIAVAQVMSQPKARRATQEAEPTPELPSNKLVISIQHKPSAQQAQFSTKPRTRVGKVLAGACKSFQLDVNVAQLYLVVVTQNDKGLKEEDYFLCDRDETVENAVAGMDERAEFMIRIPEDPAV